MATADGGAAMNESARQAWGEGTRLAVLGSPIAHSCSPRLHAAAYAALGLPWRYGLHRVEAPQLEDFLAQRGSGWRGMSLTMPLKHEAFRLVRERGDLDAAARLTGAVNTLIFSGPEADAAAISGRNTDVEGILRAISGLDARHVDLLGAGNTAASVIAAVAEAGAASVRIVARDEGRARGVIELAGTLGLSISFVSLPEWRAGEMTTLVVNTIPGNGMPIDPPGWLLPRAALFDVIYDPWPTALAASWERAGGRAVSGMEMLIAQAVAQIRHFTAGIVRAFDGAAVEHAMRSLAPGFTSS